MTSRPDKPALVRQLLLAAISGASLACSDGGCGSSGSAATGAAGSASASPSASVAASASATPARRWDAVRASGPAGAIFRAVNTIDLKEEQKATLEKIAANLREAERAERAAAADGGGPRSEMREAHAALVAGVKDGKIDASKMEPHFAAIEKATRAREEREASALNELHAALEPAQRAAIVASVRSLEEKRAERMKPRDKPDGGGPDLAKMRLQRYTHDLALDAEQQKKVEAVILKDDKAATRDETKKQTDALLAAFEKDTFDAKKIDLGASKRARAPMEAQVKFYGQLVPILKPEQRERLARNLARSGDRARPHRGTSTSERVHDHDHDDDDGDVH